MLFVAALKRRLNVQRVTARTGKTYGVRLGSNNIVFIRLLISSFVFLYHPLPLVISSAQVTYI